MKKFSVVSSLLVLSVSISSVSSLAMRPGFPSSSSHGGGGAGYSSSGDSEGIGHGYARRDGRGLSTAGVDHTVAARRWGASGVGPRTGASPDFIPQARKGGSSGIDSSEDARVRWRSMGPAYTPAGTGVGYGSGIEEHSPHEYRGFFNEIGYRFGQVTGFRPHFKGATTVVGKMVVGMTFAGAAGAGLFYWAPTLAEATKDGAVIVVNAATEGVKFCGVAVGHAVKGTVYYGLRFGENTFHAIAKVGDGIAQCAQSAADQLDRNANELYE